MMSLQKKRSWLRVLVAVLILGGFSAESANADRDSHRNERTMTGVWQTKSPAGWVVQSEFGVFTGDTRMRWELEEDGNGLISGFNLWFSPNPSEGRPSVGAMCMVGARNGRNVVITEARIRDRLLPTFEFECTHRRGNDARCVGNGFASQPPVALTGRMRRVKNPDENAGPVPAVLIAGVRAFCSGNGERPENPLLGASSTCPSPTTEFQPGAPMFGIPDRCCAPDFSTCVNFN